MVLSKNWLQARRVYCSKTAIPFLWSNENFVPHVPHIRHSQGLSIHSSPPGTEWTKNAWLVEKHDARQHQWIMTLWYTILYIADLLLYYSCMVESKQSFLPERHFNPQPCYFTQSYRCLFQLPKFKSPLGKGKKQEYSERRLLGYFIFKLFCDLKGLWQNLSLTFLISYFCFLCIEWFIPVFLMPRQN